jgi:hypothetical protein
MYSRGILFGLIILGTLVGFGAAEFLPDYSTTGTTSTPWIVANGIDQSTITVSLKNVSSGPVSGIPVTFDISDPSLGTITPQTVVSDARGEAITVFKTSHKSGTENIAATYPSTGSGSRQIVQYIDHDSPYSPVFSYPSEGTVGSEILFNISFRDRWGNRIDSRKAGDSHSVSLEINGVTPDDCGFDTGFGYSHNITRVLDNNGNASLIVRLTSKPGNNNIVMNAFGSIPDTFKWISAVTNDVPFFVTQTFDPSGSPPTLPTDGNSKFTILYQLFDRYGNPTKVQAFI